MTKEEALQALSQQYHAIKNVIDASKEEYFDDSHVANFLHSAIDALIVKQGSLKQKTATLIQNNEEEYKALAKLSINSYSNTHQAISSISDESASALKKGCDEQSKVLINSEELFNEFQAIQDKLGDEVSKANETICSLMDQVRILERKSTLDGLTRVFNRAAFDKYMQTLLEHKAALSSTFFLLLDADDFKQINDTYGHVTGDKVLQFIANAIKKSLREGDKVFRYGGEEFAVILQRTNLDGATRVSERILQTIRSNSLIYKEHKVHVTMSLSITAILQDDTTESVVTRADEGLYSAKRSGKDKIVVSGE